MSVEGLSAKQVRKIMNGYHCPYCGRGKKLDFASSIFRRTAVEKDQKGE